MSSARLPQALNAFWNRQVSRTGLADLAGLAR